MTNSCRTRRNPLIWREDGKCSFQNGRILKKEKNIYLTMSILCWLVLSILMAFPFETHDFYSNGYDGTKYIDQVGLEISGWSYVVTIVSFLLLTGSIVPLIFVINTYTRVIAVLGAALVFCAYAFSAFNLETKNPIREGIYNSELSLAFYCAFGLTLTYAIFTLIMLIISQMKESRQNKSLDILDDSLI